MNKIGKVLIALVVAALFFMAYMVERSDFHREEKVYNNGICIECGGHLEQISIWTDRADGTTFHTFKCDKCGNKYNLHYFGED